VEKFWDLNTVVFVVCRKFQTPNGAAPQPRHQPDRPSERRTDVQATKKPGTQGYVLCWFLQFTDSFDRGFAIIFKSCGTGSDPIQDLTARRHRGSQCLFGLQAEHDES
jgi:hypothetical protein